jgi:predicted phosphohydrolase
MPLRILHLSDIHFSTKFDEERIPHADVRDELLNDLRNVMVPRLGPIEKVLIAGDVAFSGKREEYEEAAKWLEEITSICGCKRTDILTVPGNHDVDRSRILPAMKSIHGRLRSCSLPDARRELIDLVSQNDGLLTDKLTDYQAFASIYGCHFPSPSRPRWEFPFPLADGFVLKFVGLNTVQVCDAGDAKGALLLGSHQYIIERKTREELVVIMHHPPEWIKDRQDASQYLDSRARVQVFGHEHLQEIHSVSDANRDARLVIASGALTPENAHDPYIYRYNILEFGLGGDRAAPHLDVTIYPRVWIFEATRFDADSARLSGRESATFTLPCPQFRLPAGDPPNPGVVPDGADVGAAGDDRNKESFAKLNYFFWRYLAWQQQLKVLVETDVLPLAVKAPSLQTIAHDALEKARREQKLEQLWDRIMFFVPEEKRELNPFSARNN